MRRTVDAGYLGYLHRQQRNSTCAVASVRTVLHRQFGLRVSENALVALGNDPHEPIVRYGTDVHGMRRMVRKASEAFNKGPSWTLRVRKRGTLRALRYWVRRGRWPIIQVFVVEALEHHAVVVLDVKNDAVLVFDPDPSEDASPRWVPKATLLEWWVSPINDERWWAVINGGSIIEYE
jgi:hypothetical protein